MAAGAVSLKNLTKREEVRKGADQANLSSITGVLINVTLQKNVYHVSRGTTVSSSVLYK